MIIYGSSLSPYVRKVLVVAHEKGLTPESRVVGPGSGDPDFRAASPFGKMPALRDGDFLLPDSSAIAAYLEAKHPEPNLIPAEPRARGRTIWFDEFADTILVTAAAKVFFNRVVAPRFLKREGDLAAADRACTVELPPILDYLESQIPESLHLVEDRPTLADIAVASPLANLAYGGFDLEAARFPKAHAFAHRMLSRPSFAACLDRDREQLARAA